jgi:hypothetical protein
LVDSSFATANDARKTALHALIDHLGNLGEKVASDAIDTIFSKLLPPPPQPAPSSATQWQSLPPTITLIVRIKGQKAQIIRVPADGSDER